MIIITELVNYISWQAEFIWSLLKKIIQKKKKKKKKKLE